MTDMTDVSFSDVTPVVVIVDNTGDATSTPITRTVQAPTFTYAHSPDGDILRSDGALIPDDPTNSDYAAYLVWVAAGNTTAPLPAAPATYLTVSMWQAKAILQLTPFAPASALPAVRPILVSCTNLLAATNALVLAAGDPVLTSFWNTASTIDQNSPTLLRLASQLGVTSDQIAALFTAAAALHL